jgi:type II secretory pathway component PulF
VLDYESSHVTVERVVQVAAPQQVEAEVKGLTSLIEPIMIAVMGFIVGGIVLAVFLPIFKMQEALSK